MRPVVKKLSIFFTTAILLLIGLYLSLLLIFPFVLNRHDYSAFLEQKVKDQTGLELIFDDYKIKLSPSFSLSLKAGHIALFYPNKQQILDIKNAKIDISTLSLLKKEIKIKKIDAENFQFSSKLKTNGKLSLQDYLEQNVKSDSNFHYSQDLPAITIDDALIKIKDEKSGHHYKLTGRNFRLLPDFTGKNFLISSRGDIYIKGKKSIDYKLKLVLPGDLINNTEKKPINLTELAKYTLKATIDADLRVFSKHGKYCYTEGKIDVTGFSLLINGAYTPKSTASVTLEKSQALLSAKLFTAKNENADINAKIKLTKPMNIAIRCKTSNINIANLKTILVPVLDLLKIKNNLGEFSANGFIKADFNLKTDFKKVKSSGNLRINNAELKHKKIPLEINRINANIDFSENRIKILNSGLFINKQPVNITGSVDTDATGDIKLSAKNLELNHILNAFPNLKPDEKLTFTSGKLSFSAFLKGKLTKIAPVLAAEISDISAQLKDVTFAAKNITINADVQNNVYNGNAQLKKMSVRKQDAPVSLTSELVNFKFDEKTLEIIDSEIFAGKTPIRAAGIIKNYRKTPVLDINAAGTIDTELIKSFLNTKDIEAKGALPTVLNIKTKDEITIIKLHSLANNNNYIKHKSLYPADTTTSLTKLAAEINGDLLNIKELTLYNAANVQKASLETNTAALRKIATISGSIQKEQFQNLKIHIPQRITLNIPCGAFKTDGSITVNGSFEVPDISGILNIYDFHMPDFGVSLSQAAANFSKNDFNTSINGLKIRNMTINTDISAGKNFLKTKKISNVKIYSNLIDMDELLKMKDILPQTTYAPGPECPFDIQTGEIALQTFKMGKIFITSVDSAFSVENNVLHLHDLSADAYGGKIAAKIDYNLPYATLHAIVQGRNLNALTAGRSLFPVDPKTEGIMSFDADVKTFGYTQEQQKKNLTGSTDLLVKNAKLGPLGRFEHFLYAQNLISQKFIYVSLNSAKQAITPKDTGRVNYLKASVKFKNGYMHINPALTSGPQMSMYIKGSVNIMNNLADLIILGKISPEVSSSLGLFGQKTIKDFLNQYTNSNISDKKTYNKNLPDADISKIPPLTPSLDRETRCFRVIIDGDTDSVKAVKSFTWVNPVSAVPPAPSKNIISAPKSVTKEQVPAKSKDTAIQEKQQPAKQTIPEKQETPLNFLDSIPDEFSETKVR